MNSKKQSVFVQTDKAMYKPGDNVQFRVLVLNSELKPFANANVAIFISDGAQNRVKQFENIAFTKGVYESSMQLSEFPVLGKWRINVKVNGIDTIKQFDVDKYTLPTFELKLDSNPNIAYKDGKVSVNVLAKYTFGKLAKGNATISAEYGGGYDYSGGRPRGGRWGGWGTPIKLVKVSKSGPVDGKKPLEFDMDKELKITDKTKDTVVRLSASFKEELTGKEVTATASVTIRQHPHKVQVTRSASKYKPGLPFSVTAIVQSYDKDAPITDEKNPLEVIVKHYYSKTRRCERYQQPHTTKKGQVFNKNATEYFACREQKFFELEAEAFVINGIANVNIDVPERSEMFDVTVKYLGVSATNSYIQRAASACDQYLQIKSLTEKPRVGEELVIEVLTSADVERVNYQVSGSGDIFMSSSVASEGSRKFTFTFEPSLDMLPSVRVLVYYIVNGEIISDSVNVVFESGLKNTVSNTHS